MKITTKQKTIKAWAVARKEFLMNWIPDRSFTGAYALFENKEQAVLAIKYNASLVKMKKRSKEQYKVIPCEIIIKKN